MSTAQNTQVAIKSYFQNHDIRKKFEEVLGKKAQGFITSVVQISSSNYQLQKCEPQSIMNAAMMAAVLDLPIQESLGYAYIVPYKDKAQFQVGWKGFVQLAQRSGQYLRINVVEVFANQFKGYNNLTEELTADFGVDGSGEIVGYCAYFRLMNGFEKTVYWSREKVQKHALKYSQAYKSEKGITPWKDKDQFHEMAKKTVLKNTLTKWGPMSIEMQKAVKVDQGIIEDIEGQDVTYMDNQQMAPDKERERVMELLSAEYSSVEEFQKNVVDRMSTDLRGELDLEISLKIQEIQYSIENKGGANG